MHRITEISVLERLSLLSIFLRLRKAFCLISHSELSLTASTFLAFGVLVSVLFSPISKRFRKKRLNRIFVEAATRFLIDRVTIRQAQWATGTSLNTYLKWAKRQDIMPVVEELEGDAKLVWLTERRTDQVLLYVHGMYLYMYL